ncbi:MAG TPA: ATP-binding cassette domain-containing protein, partial [Campylobacteraceae bacterium]|nr:ATP-binding cassette domain-containing protein [Campylobacteraceae bacterium]
ILGALAAAAVIILGGQEVIDGQLSVGSFFSFLTALFMLYTPIKKVSRIFNQIQDAIAANERIQQLLQRTPQIKEGSKTFDETIERIAFEHVTLSYDKEKKALEDISFEVHKGEKIALVGNSGGGKSSIVNMILRFYEPQSGRILFNDTDIAAYNLKSLRNEISIVTQRVYILNDSVAANVAYGEAVDEAKVIRALQDANAWDFIRDLPEGIHTRINEFGTNFSGGQRQRIAIARAIYRDPQIFIFDEATSALDSESEQKITDAINRIAERKITFIIAHRMNSIVHADRIFVLREGKLVCNGNNSELLKQCDEFKRLKGLQK